MKTNNEYKAELNQLYEEYYKNIGCSHCNACFAKAASPVKFCFDCAAKVGSEYGKSDIPKILVVGKEGKAYHCKVGDTTEKIEDADNEHYRKTLYTLSLFSGIQPDGFSKEHLKKHENLLKSFCLTNYFKCALQGSGVHSPHTKAMKENCWHLLEKEIDILEPDCVVLQGKFSSERFWKAYEAGEEIAASADAKLSLYRYQHKSGKEFYVLYSFHPCYFRAWSGNLLAALKTMIDVFRANFK